MFKFSTRGRRVLLCGVCVSLALLYLIVYLDSHLDSFECVVDPQVLHAMPKTVPRRSDPTTSQLIPRRIFQTNEEKVLPRMRGALQSWMDLNPEYDYHYFTSDDQRKYIENHFDETVLLAYDMLIPGAYKADLWRYCVLYKEGGVYADSAMVDVVPLREILSPGDDFVSPVDDGVYAGIYNAFIASTSGHPILKMAIELTVSRVLREEYGFSFLFPTGPMCLGEAVNTFLERDPSALFLDFIEEDGIRLLYRFTPPEDMTGHVYDKHWRVLIDTKYPCFLQEEAYWMKTQYADLWRARKIYRTDSSLK